LGNFPVPGDPDLNSPILSAVPANPGIRVSWTYPNVFPEAVAYTKLFRSTVNNHAGAAVLAYATGSVFIDNNGVAGTTYYYWIQMVSVNGTIGDVIGPASCIYNDSIADIIAGLEDQIGSSMLNQYLKDKIDLITDVSSGLTQEQMDRYLGDSILNDLWAQVQTDMDAIDTLIVNETLARVTADSAAVATINGMFAQVNANAAAILEEQVVRADADSATALSVSTLQTTVNGHTNSIQTLQLVDSQIGAMYGVKLDVNGYVAGFGLYNSGSSSLFLVNADQFAIGKPGATTDLPFIVSGGVVYMKNAMIQDAAITNAKIGDEISSNGYDFFTTGWGIHKSLPGYPNGVAVFHDIIARGNIEATSIQAGTIDIIDTLMIQGNAVTVPASAVSSVTLSGTVGTWVNAVTSPAITVAAGQPIQVQVSAEITKTGGSGQSLVRYSLVRDLTTIYTCLSAQGSRVYADESELISFNFQDIPGAGPHAYTLRVTRGDSGGATIKAENASITVTGLKR
jgi:hypothetical protein